MIPNYRTSTLCRLLSSIACGILLTAFTGCSNNQSTSLGDDLPSVGAPVEINIRTNGIESFADAEEVATRAALAGSTAAEQTEQTVHTQVQPLDGGRLLVATVKASKATRVTAASPTSTRAAITLKNTTLRVLAYNSDGQYVDECLYDVDGSGIATAMNGQQLVVPARATPYTFYCYSPGVSCYSNTDTKEVSVGAADTFAFGTLKATINGSSNTQTVSFPTLAQKMARIKMAVTSTDDAIPVDRYTAALTRGEFVNSATFSLTNGVYSSFGTASARSLPFDTSVAEHLILPSGDTGGMTLTLSNLVMGGRALSSPPIEIPAITLAAGTRYTLDIKVQPVLSNVPFVLLPSIKLRVAKGNLMRANGTGHWYLAPDQGYYTGQKDGGDYFCWGIADPTSVNNSGGVNTDVLTAGCVAVLGPGWRVPTKAENLALVEQPHKMGTIYSQRGWVNGIYFGASNQIASGDYAKCVFLPCAGFRDEIGTMFTVNDEGNYWSSETSFPASGFSFNHSSEYIKGDRIFGRDSGRTLRCVANI